MVACCRHCRCGNFPRGTRRCHRIPHSWWLSGLAASTVLCAAVLVPMFDLRLYEPFVAVAVALLVAVLAVRALVRARDGGNHPRCSVTAGRCGLRCA